MKTLSKAVSRCLILIILINFLSINLPLEISGSYLIDADIYRRHDNGYMKIALTFDDGPHPKITPKILDILDKYGIKATFFCVGLNASYYPDTLRMVVQRGHELGNHTHTHHVTVDSLINEIEDCEDIIYSKTGYKTKLFRPPEGMIDESIMNIVRRLDYRMILWDIDTRDWAHTPSDEIAKKVINSVKSGDIILMHDYIGSDSPTSEAIEIFIPALIAKGYRFVTISELIDTK